MGLTGSHIVGAGLWMLGALVSFIAMAVGGRELAADLPVIQYMFIRSLIGLIIVALVCWRSGVGQLRLRYPGIHFCRNLFHFGAQYGWFFAVSVIPLAEVFAIEFTTPIWTAMIATFALGERLTRTRITTILLGFTGILIILRPGLEAIDPVAFIVLAAAVGFSTTHVFTKKLSRDQSSLNILFYMVGMQAVFGLVPALMVWQTPPLASWPWLITIGIAAFTAHYCIAQAMKLADATVVAPMDFMRLPLVALVGFLLYNEQVDLALFLGAGLILTGNLMNIRKEHRRTA
ncbi:DMT family transporter [Aestuariispira ectoiniformans]|uniref:DMT family transporter n=1 Tax=Aestuariispira ectoiniformans TaxID=2775080 RepID=UPI00223B4F37|nr:DMT family transporter [Aestuariispira ectoiniformans]